MPLSITLGNTLRDTANFLKTAIHREPQYELLPTQSQAMPGEEHNKPSRLPTLPINGRLAKRAATLAVTLCLVYLAAVWYKNLPDYHGLPTYKNVWKVQRSLPQLDSNLPWPEGRDGSESLLSLPSVSLTIY